MICLGFLVFHAKAVVTMFSMLQPARSATYLKVDWDKKSNYDILYGDQSRSGGYYASNTFTFDGFHGSIVTSNSSTVVFE